MHFPEHINIRKRNASLTVEAAVLMPLIVFVLIVFLGLIKFLIGYQVLSSTIYDCADCMADFGDIYEVLGLGKIHRAVLSEAIEEEEPVSDLLTGGLKIPEEEVQALEPIFGMIMDVLKPAEIKQAIKQKVYFYLIDRAGQQLTRGLIKSRLGSIDLEAMGIKDGVEGLSLEGSRFLYQEAGHGALIQLRISYQPEIFPGSSWLIPDPAEISVTVHAFLGKNPFEAKLRTEELYYQIGMGEKYHRLDCYLIDKDVSCITLQEAQRRGYQSCRRCRSWEEGTVWITSGGERYHRADCSYLYPNLQSMTKKEAEEKGLTPCELCQGSGGGFG